MPGRSSSAPGTLSASARQHGTDQLTWSDVRSPCNAGTDQWSTGLPALVIADAGGSGRSRAPTTTARPSSAASTYTSAPFKRGHDRGRADRRHPQAHGAPRPTRRSWPASMWSRPDGSSRAISSGALLGSLRALDRRRSWFEDGRLILPWHPYTSASARAIPPGRPVKLDIEVYPTLARIAPGDRLRLTLTSGDTALQPSPVQISRLAGGRYSILRSGSSITLPMASRRQPGHERPRLGRVQRVVLRRALLMARRDGGAARQRMAATAAADPPITVPRGALRAALQCPRRFVHRTHEPVLLVHGTGLNADESWAWNYELALPPSGFDWCAVTLPNRALGDIQVSSRVRGLGGRADPRADSPPGGGHHPQPGRDGGPVGAALVDAARGPTRPT